MTDGKDRLRGVEEALDALTREPSPTWAALRSLHQEESGQRLLGLLWEHRPHLVGAVALWARIKGRHPEIQWTRRVEPLHEAAKTQLGAAYLDALHRGKWVRDPNGPPPWIFERPPLDLDALARVFASITTAEQEVERLHRPLVALNFLGWGGWDVGEDGRIARPPGQGEPMPRWVLSTPPADTEPDSINDVPSPEGGWWWAHGIEDGKGVRSGLSLRRGMTEAIWDALDRPPKGRQSTREQIVPYVPDVFAELRDSGPNGALRNELKNIIVPA